MNALSSGLVLNNLSDARDTQTMNQLLTENKPEWDVLDAGTTMRFCTAFLAVRGNGQVITGSDRMKQRPIGLLVDALQDLGADITYQEKKGFPPLRISKILKQKTESVSIPGNISSQFISALLMIAPDLPRGLELTLTGEIFSIPYIKMTLGLMSHFGIKHSWNENKITIHPQTYQSNEYTVESDWSGASYWYSMVALSKDARIELKGLKKESYQGDQAIADIMTHLGVHTEYIPGGVVISNQEIQIDSLILDFKKCPDLAQTVMVAAAAKGISLEMTGLESLRIKETDRIRAMQIELDKIGTKLEEQEGRWFLVPGNIPDEIPHIETYEDHRMAMAFAPLSMVRDITIEDPDVVKKSYPGFWKDLETIGVELP